MEPSKTFNEVPRIKNVTMPMLLKWPHCTHFNSFLAHIMLCPESKDLLIILKCGQGMFAVYRNEECHAIPNYFTHSSLKQEQLLTRTPTMIWAIGHASERYYYFLFNDVHSVPYMGQSILPCYLVSRDETALKLN